MSDVVRIGDSSNTKELARKSRRTTKEYTLPAFDHIDNSLARFLGDFINYAVQSGQEERLLKALPRNSPIFQTALNTSSDGASADTPVAKSFNLRADLVRLGNLICQYDQMDWSRIQKDLVACAINEFNSAKTKFGEVFDRDDFSRGLINLLISNPELTINQAAQLCLAASDDTPKAETCMSAESIGRLSAILDSADHYYEKKLILAALGKEPNSGEKITIEDLGEFLQMDRALRELKMQRIMVDLWNDESHHPIDNLKILVPKYRRAHARLYSLPGIISPSASEKAVAIASNLSPIQEKIIYDAVGHIDLKAFAKMLSEKKFTFDDILPPNNIKSAAAMAVKLFTGGQISLKERNLISAAVSKAAKNLKKDDLANLRKAIRYKSEGRTYLPTYYRYVLASSTISLRKLAFLEAEYSILADFLGQPFDQPNVGFNDPAGIYVENNSKTALMGTSLTIKNQQKQLRLQMLCEGDLEAVKIAIEVIEIFALRGWIQEAQDLRIALLVADLSISNYQISQKSNDEDWLHIENHDSAKTAILFEEGNNAYCINAGLCYKIFRDNQILLASDANSTHHQNTALGSFLPSLNINNSGSPVTLMPKDIVMLHSKDLYSQFCDHDLISIVMEYRDTKSMLDLINNLALTRTQSNETYAPLNACGCNSRSGTVVDIGVQLRLIER